MNKSDLFDNRKYYLIDMTSLVVFTPGVDDPTEALNKALEVNEMPTPITRFPIAVGVIKGFAINKVGRKSTLPITTLLNDRQKALKK